MKKPSLSLLRVSVLAGRLNVSPQTIRRWCLEGRLAYTQPGGPRGVMLIYSESVDDLLVRWANGDPGVTD